MVSARDATLAPMPNETASVRIRKDLLKPAKLAAAGADMTLEAWLNRAIEAAVKREAPPHTS